MWVCAPERWRLPAFAKESFCRLDVQSSRNGEEIQQVWDRVQRCVGNRVNNEDQDRRRGHRTDHDAGSVLASEQVFGEGVEDIDGTRKPAPVYNDHLCHGVTAASIYRLSRCIYLTIARVEV